MCFSEHPCLKTGSSRYIISTLHYFCILSLLDVKSSSSKVNILQISNGLALFANICRVLLRKAPRIVILSLIKIKKNKQMGNFRELCQRLQNFFFFLFFEFFHHGAHQYMHREKTGDLRNPIYLPPLYACHEEYGMIFILESKNM